MGTYPIGTFVTAPSERRPSSPRAVFKIGGSCLRSTRAFDRVAEIARAELDDRPGRPVVLVLSALSGITAALDVAWTRARRDGVVDVAAVAGPHLAALGCLPDPARAAASCELGALLGDLAHHLERAASGRGGEALLRDAVLAAGERASILVGAALLRGLHGIPARALVGAAAGLECDDRAGDATLLDASAPRVRERLSASGVHLVAGFVADRRDGAGLATLGRGGSDYTAAFIAGVFGRPAILLKDTPGVCTADPAAVPGAPVVERLDYADALLLGRLGAQVVFEKAVLEAARHGISIRVRAFEPATAGADGGNVAETVIEPASDALDRIPEVRLRSPALACARDVELVADDGTDVTSGAWRVRRDPLARLETLPSIAGAGLELGPRSVLAGRAGRSPGAPTARPADELALVSIFGAFDDPDRRAAVLACLDRASVRAIAIGQVVDGEALAVVVARDRATPALQALHDAVVTPLLGGPRPAVERPSR